MNSRTLVSVLFAFLLPFSSANGACAACGSGDTSPVSFRGSTDIEADDDCSVTAVLNITGPEAGGGRTVSSPSPGALGDGDVVTGTGTIDATHESIYSGTLTVSKTGAVNACYCNASVELETSNSCGWVMEIRSVANSGGTAYGDWHKALSCGWTFDFDNQYSSSSDSVTLCFQFRWVRKSDDGTAPGGSGGAGSGSGACNGGGAGMEEGLGGVEPATIPDEKQDVPPATTGGPPAEITPAGYKSTLQMGATAASAGFNTGSLSLSGQITTGLANVSNLKVLDPGINGLAVVNVSGCVRQVENSDTLADVQALQGGGFQVRFYGNGMFDTTPVDGLYPIHTGAAPRLTVSYAPLEASAPTHLGGIRVTWTGPNGIARQRDILSTSGDGTSWRVIRENGDEVRDFTTQFLYSGDSSRWQRCDVDSLSRGGTLYSKAERTYAYQCRREGPTGPMVENHLFTLDEKEFTSADSFLETVSVPDANHLGRIGSVTHPDGSWEKYVYYMGSETGAQPCWSGLTKQILRPWNGNPSTPAQATPSNSQATSFVYDYGYSLFTSGEGLGHRATLSTTTVPGASQPVKSTSLTGGYNLSTLTDVLGAAGFPSGWIPGSASVESHNSEESAGGSETISTTSYTYSNTGLPWYGSSLGSLDGDGDGTVTGYELGTYNGGQNPSFTANDPATPLDGGTDIRSTTVKVMGATLPAATEATKTIEIRDRHGKILRREFLVMLTEGNWTLATATTFNYLSVWEDGSAKETSEVRDGREVSHVTAISGSETDAWDEQGIETDTVTDDQGRVATVTRVGTQDQPDLVTAYTYNGRTTTTVESAGGLTRTRISVEDLAGRTVSETLPGGATTQTSYPNSGRDTLTTLPGGLTRLESRDISGHTVSITGDSVVGEHYEYGVLDNGHQTTTRRLGSLDNSPRYTITEEDQAGRTVNVTSPSPTGSGTVTTAFFYATGTSRMISQTSPSGIVLFRKPSGNSSLSLSGMDANDTGDLEIASTDRVTETAGYYALDRGYVWQVSSQKTYDVDGDGGSAMTTATRSCLHGNPEGLASLVVSTGPGGQSTETRTAIDAANKTSTRTEITGGTANNAISISVNGLLVSAQGHDSTHPARWTYDGFGQPVRETSPRGGATVTTYNPDGTRATVTDASGQTTGYTYYGPAHMSAGRVATVTNPLGKTTTYVYSSLGKVTEQAGTAGYKVTYEYDDYGAISVMRTWRDANTGDPTTWTYQDGTGLLLSKTDAGGKSTTYTYCDSGKASTRAWARGVTTTYAYNSFGDLTGITYSDSTPAVTFSGHDRLGRPATVTRRGTGAEHMTYHPGTGTPQARYFDSGHAVLPGIGIRQNAPDDYGRTSGFKETTGSDATVIRTVAYSYDTSGRLGTVSDGGQSHTYAYHPDSSLVYTITSGTGENPWFRQSRYFDVPGRLIGIRTDHMSGTNATPVTYHAYNYDPLGRRTRNTFQDGSYWQYGYNDRSEVISASRKTAAGVYVPQLDASYSFDGIGNRLSSTSQVLGDHTYTPDSRNRYATITTGNSRTAIGRAPTDWTIEVNGSAAARIGEIFHRQLTAANSTAPVWEEVTTQRNTGTPTVTNHYWYAKQSFTPSYDDDGNLTGDGRWSYVWDAENRLVEMETTTQATTAGHPYTKLVFIYDWQGRRVARHVWKGGTAETPTFLSSTRWLYDGWNVIAEFSGTSDTDTSPTRTATFTWGLDLSGTLQGAGGVGGLLSHTTLSGGVTESPSFDGNGNIVAWTRSNEAAPFARREYDAFGNAVVSEGTAPCGFGFSTKIRDGETGLCYYGFRYYDPVMGRWPSRDPVEERGGLNLNSFLANDGMNGSEFLGLKLIEYKGPAIIKKQSVGGGGGQCEPLWDGFITRKPGPNFNYSTVWMNGQQTGDGILTVTITYDPTDASEPIDHERRHEAIAKKYWNMIAQETNWLERSWCEPCGPLAVKYGTAAYKYRHAQAAMENAELDVEDYPKYHISEDKIRSKKADLDLKTKARDAAKAEYDKAYKSFTDASCNKL